MSAPTAPDAATILRQHKPDAVRSVEAHETADGGLKAPLGADSTRSSSAKVDLDTESRATAIQGTSESPNTKPATATDRDSDSKPATDGKETVGGQAGGLGINMNGGNGNNGEQVLDKHVVQSQHITASPPPTPPPKDARYTPTLKQAEHSGVGQYDEAITAREEEAALGGETEELAGSSVLDDSKSEIQSIMEQCEDDAQAPGEEEIMSPRTGRHSSMIASTGSLPPRQDSLEASSGKDPAQEGRSLSDAFDIRPPRTSSLISMGSISSLRHASTSQDTTDAPLSPQTSRNLPPPPQPDPEPDLPFDFHRFLEQLRHRTADPVAKYLRSFLLEFAKRQWLVHEQVKLIADFLEFISKKMAQCEVWRNVSDAEFDNAREGMEKLVMNRLYNQTFSPAIAPADPAQGARGKRRLGQAPLSPTKPGRQGQHQEDVERDEVLAQKVRIYGWVKEEHLDIKPVGDKGRKFMTLAQQELLKIRSYRAPRDKVICVLNSCKVIFGFLRNSQHDQSADSFIPLLIYVVLKANPDHLVSNVQYILRFRNQDKLGGEAGYYISSLMGAIQFVEGLDKTSLTISDEEFEKNVEAAVSVIAEPHVEEAPPPQLPSRPTGPQILDKAAPSRAEVTARHSTEPEQVSPRKGQSSRSDARSDDDGDDLVLGAGLLRTIQKPLNTIGRIFSDDASTTQSRQQTNPSAQATGEKPRLSPRPSTDGSGPSDSQRQRSPRQLSAEDVAARQASTEAEEARKIRRREEKNVVETLCGMFPNLDKDVIQDVVRANEGRIGTAVDACLALNG